MPTQKKKKTSKREKIKDQSCESNSGEGELEYTRTTLVPLVALKALKALLKTTRNTAHKKGQTHRSAPTLREKPRICHFEQSEKSQLTFHFDNTV